MNISDNDSTDKKDTIIVKIGSRFLEVGLAGEPKALINTSISDFSAEQLIDIHYQDDLFGFSEDEDVKQVIEKSFRQFKFIFYRDCLVYDNGGNDGKERESSTDIKSLEYNLKIHLNYIFRIIFKKKLQFNLNDSSHQIIIVQNQYFNKNYERLIVDGIRANYVSTRKLISFQSNSLMSLVSTGTNNGLVIDLGFNLTTFEPIFEFRVLSNFIRFTKRAGFEIHKFYLNLFMKNVPKFNLLNNQFEFIEEFIINHTYIRPSSTSTMIYPNTNKYIIVKGLEIPKEFQYEPLEKILFPLSQSTDIDNTASQLQHRQTDEDFNDLNDGNIIEITINLIKSLPIDLRTVMLDNLILIGGVSKIPGFKTRFINELRNALNKSDGNSKVRCLKSLGSWCGASLYSYSLLSKYESSALRKSKGYKRVSNR